jgi:hypothetical protein
MPLVAQVSGAVALTALVFGPWWASVPEQVPQPKASASPVAQAPAVVQEPTVQAVPASQAAHLNLDVRHSLQNIQLAIAVDGKPVLDTALEGSGKRFRVFGKRSERSYTKRWSSAPAFASFAFACDPCRINSIRPVSSVST